MSSKNQRAGKFMRTSMTLPYWDKNPIDACNTLTTMNS